MKKNLYSFFITSFFFFILGPIIGGLVLINVKNSLSSYIALFIPYLVTFIAVVFLGGIRKFKPNEDKKFRWKIFALIFFIALLFFILTSLLEKPYIYQASLSIKLLYMTLSLVLVPIQVTTEEYLFRVLPLRISSAIAPLESKKEKGILIVVSGIIFTIPHLMNKEVWATNGYWAVLYYLIWGLLAMAVVIDTKGFEVPLGIHLANNLFVAIVVNYSGSSLSSVPFFITDNETSTPQSLCLMILLFIAEWIVAKKCLRKNLN